MNATVKTFRPDAGFGTLQWDDGSEVQFDIAASSIDLTGTLDGLAEWIGEVLERRGRAERWVGVPSGGEFEIFVLREAGVETSLFGAA